MSTIGKPVDLWIKNPGVGTGGYVQYVNPIVNSSRLIFFETTHFGNRGIVLRIGKHLWKLQDVKINANSEPNVVGTWLLTNGDVDGDNIVSIFDYIELSLAFGTVAGDADWNERADLDEDGEVTIFDYIILSNNFDIIGDF